MRIVEQSFEVLSPFTREDAIRTLEIIELAGRTCYKSEGAICEGSASKFVAKLANVYKHESVLEHSSVTVRFVTDRGVSHEIVRHRIAAYSQESTRFCKYSNDSKFPNGITLIHPKELNAEQRARREAHFWLVQALYDQELSEGLSPSIARGVLPTALKTELVMTCNLREWLHVFRMRVSPQAHPQMRELMQALQYGFHLYMPELFNSPYIPELAK